MSQEIIHGDCLNEMRIFSDNHFSGIVTDPPYGLQFMGKHWDQQVPGKEYWREMLRICKPGSFLLAFGGTRTYHRLACAIEDAGWEIRDCLQWVYGSGFPKSLDLNKAIDKQKYLKKDALLVTTWIKDKCKELNISRKKLNEICDTATEANHFFDTILQPHIPTSEQWRKIKVLLGDCPVWMENLIKPSREPNENFRQRRIINTEVRKNSPTGLVSCGREGQTIERKITEAHSELSKRFDGYGTALKPSYEPIIMAMKPCDGTFAQNAEKWGQAGINIDGCRIDSKDDLRRNCLGHASAIHEGYKRPNHETAEKKLFGSTNGRWPANVIFDEEAGKILDEQSGNSTSRFFYCAKASSAERNEGLEGLPDYSCYNESNPQPNRDLRAQKLIKNNHPTVKPLKLMEYLLKLISPPKDAIILDPFAGSGTTLLAAKNLGISCIGIEKEEAYCEIIRGRLNVKQLDFMEKMA